MGGGQGLTTDERRVCELIESRADELLEDLRLHVGIETGPGGAEGVERSRRLFADRMRALGAELTLEPGRPKAAWLRGPAGMDAPGGPDAPLDEGVPPTAVLGRLRPGLGRVLIAGHLDTVHPAGGAFRGLEVSPDGTRAVGPGCVDMKGGLVIAAAALEALERAGLSASWTLCLNADEETGTYHSAHTLRELARGHDVGLALEPALPGGELAVERKGSGQFMIEARGRAAHVGRAFEQGVSAVTALARAIVAVGELADPQRTGHHVMNIGPLVGGGATNAVADRAAAWGNVRFARPEEADAIAHALEGLGTPHADCEGHRAAVVVRRSFNRPAKPLTPQTERLALRAKEAAGALGQRLEFASTGGVCDGNILQDAGLPTIDTLGVRGGGLHTPTEWIELASLVERCQLLAVLVHRLSVGGAS